MGTRWQPLGQPVGTESGRLLHRVLASDCLRSRLRRRSHGQVRIFLLTSGSILFSTFTCVIKQQGVDTEESYPYVGMDGFCKFNPKTVGATIDSFAFVQQNTEQMQVRSNNALFHRSFVPGCRLPTRANFHRCRRNVLAALQEWCLVRHSFRGA